MKRGEEIRIVLGRIAAARLLEQAQQALIVEGRSPAVIELVGLLRLVAEARCSAVEERVLAGVEVAA